MPGNSDSPYRYSFSGSDARVFIYFEGAPHLIVPLEAMHTLSVSVYEAKGQSRALGHRGIKGIARGIRTIGGSLILTVIEDNPLRPIMEHLNEYIRLQGSAWPGWSVDRNEVGTGSALDTFQFTNRIAPLLPPMNLLVQYVSEGAKYQDSGDGASTVNVEGASLLIKGVEFVNDSIVTSTNDINSEVTLQFMARDFKPLAANTFTAERKFPGLSNDQRQDAALQARIGRGDEMRRQMLGQSSNLADGINAIDQATREAFENTLSSELLPGGN